MLVVVGLVYFLFFCLSVMLIGSGSIMFVRVVGNDYAYICFMIENKSHFLIPIELLSLEVWSKVPEYFISFNS